MCDQGIPAPEAVTLRVRKPSQGVQCPGIVLPGFRVGIQPARPVSRLQRIVDCFVQSPGSVIVPCQLEGLIMTGDLVNPELTKLAFASLGEYTDQLKVAAEKGAFVPGASPSPRGAGW